MSKIKRFDFLRLLIICLKCYVLQSPKIKKRYAIHKELAPVFDTQNMSKTSRYSLVWWNLRKPNQKHFSNAVFTKKICQKCNACSLKFSDFAKIIF